MDIDAFLSMGGYAGFIWPSYALMLVVLVALLVASLNGARSRENELDMLQQRRGRRRAAKSEAKAE
ncbi:MAG TPA: heme exporter protein CcmD [Candidatus Omnitrophota bacterium]|nr:heme exporter protein CcmD [Candidatus Omnitrophota bacterium]